MFSGAVFDFDGVIVDSHPVHMRAWRKFLDSMGRVVAEEQMQFVLDGRKREEILRHFLGDLSDEKLIEYGHLKEQIFRDEAANVQMIEGLVSFLEDLENAQLVLGIASSGSRSRVDFLLDQLDLKRRFPIIVTGDEVGEGKPNPAVFLKAAHDLRMDPEDLIVFEDAISGVKAAKAAGMKCIGIAQPEHASMLLDAGADYVAPDFCLLSYAKLQQLFA